MKESRGNSYLFGGNAPYVEELYEAYLDNPGSVPDKWRSYFDALPESDPSKMSFAGDAKKAWKDIWGCGQGIGAIKAVVPAAELVARLAHEYEAARAKLAGVAPTLRA